MKSTQKRFSRRASVVAVHGALAAMAAVPMTSAAQMSEELRELTQPKSQIEVGVGYVNKKSAKFGEFNGLDDNGAYLIGGFDLRGGDGDNGAFRWRAKGSDIGLDTRSLNAEFGTQGRYRFSFGYDELKRVQDDSFQTIYEGTGSTRLTLPAGYPAASTRLSSTANANAALANWANLQSPYATTACAATGGVPTAACQGPGYLIPALMRNPGDIETKRSRGDFGFSYLFSPEWEVKASARREKKEGVKLTGFGVNGPGRGFILPEPINSTTDIYEAGVAYVGKSAYLNFGYSGSTYRNDTNLWTADNPFQNNSMLNNIAQLTGAPDNQMHQFNFSGGFTFAPKTKLVVSGSRTRMTQNESYNVTYPASVLIPVGSANAKVINDSFLARLTARPMKQLGLTVAYKYDNRDNQTPSNLYSVIGADNGTSPNTNRTFINEPFNRKQQRFNVDADYSLGRSRVLAAGYEWQKIGYSGHGEIPIPAHGNKENTWRLEYRDVIAEKLTGRVAYAHGQRKMTSSYHEGDPLPQTPVIPDDISSLIATGRITVNPTTGVITQVAPFAFASADPLLPNYRMFFLADRKRDKLRGSLNFQASEALSLDANLEFNRDVFNNSQWGLKESKDWRLSLDAGYTASETLSFSASYTYEDMKSRMDNRAILRGTVANPLVAGSTSSTLTAANTDTTCATTNTGTPANYWLDPCRNWGMSQADKVNTFALGFRSKGLMGNKLELNGDLVYSHSRSPITVNGGTFTSNGTVNVWYAAQSLPEITSSMTEIRLSGKYAIDKASAVRLNYLGRRLRTADFQYDAYAYPVPFQSFLSTGQTSPDYTVHAVGVTYLYSFR